MQKLFVCIRIIANCIAKRILILITALTVGCSGSSDSVSDSGAASDGSGSARTGWDEGNPDREDWRNYPYDAGVLSFPYDEGYPPELTSE